MFSLFVLLKLKKKTKIKTKIILLVMKWHNIQDTEPLLYYTTNSRSAHDSVKRRGRRSDKSIFIKYIYRLFYFIQKDDEEFSFLLFPLIYFLQQTEGNFSQYLIITSDLFTFNKETGSKNKQGWRVVRGRTAILMKSKHIYCPR
jgi:hypothetical protein